MAINDGAIYSALNDQNLLSACKLKWNIKSINRALLSPLTIPGKKLEIVLKTVVPTVWTGMLLPGQWVFCLSGFFWVVKTHSLYSLQQFIKYYRAPAGSQHYSRCWETSVSKNKEPCSFGAQDVVRYWIIGSNCLTYGNIRFCETAKSYRQLKLFYKNIHNSKEMAFKSFKKAKDNTVFRTF